MLYSASALFAIATAQWASIPLYQQWGRLAVGPYAAGAVASAVAARHSARRAAHAAALAAPAEGRPPPSPPGRGRGGTGPRRGP